MKTPSLGHIQYSDYDHVYEPAEDSMLLIDALEKEVEKIKEKNPTLCLEIGSGSGIVIAAFGLEFPKCVCLCTDINIKACHLSNSTIKRNHVTGENVNMNLAECFLDDKFDVIFFNPPYVLTDTAECRGNGIEASWAGGHKGREVIDKLLDMVPSKLAKDGWFYLLLIRENIPEEVVALMASKGFESELIIERRVWNEKQFVYKFFRD